MDLVFYIALTLTVFLIVALLLAPVILRPSPAARRMLEMVRSNRPDERNVGSKERMQETILSMARNLRVRFGLAEDEKVKQQLLSAGVRTSRGMNAYSASRILGPFRAWSAEASSTATRFSGLCRWPPSSTCSRTCG